MYAPLVCLQNSKATLPVGSRGVLVSCVGGKEQYAAKDSIRILSQVQCGTSPAGLEIHCAARAQLHTCLSCKLPHAALHSNATGAPESTSSNLCLLQFYGVACSACVHLQHVPLAETYCTSPQHPHNSPLQCQEACIGCHACCTLAAVLQD